MDQIIVFFILNQCIFSAPKNIVKFVSNLIDFLEGFITLLYLSQWDVKQI